MKVRKNKYGKVLDGDTDYWLNQFGERAWYKKTDISMCAWRHFSWIDRITIIHESSTYLTEDGLITTTDRHHVNSTTLEIMSKELEKDWVIIKDFNTYAKMLHSYYLKKMREKKLNSLNKLNF